MVRRRRMVRTYTPDPVDPALVDRLLDNAVRAPSAGFSQGWGFLVLDDPADVARFWRSTTPVGVERPSAWLEAMRVAPVVVVPHSNRAEYLTRYAQDDKRWTDPDADPWAVPYWHVDAGMASLLILQTAVDLGLGACFFGIPAARTQAFRAEFGVPDEFTPVGGITVGHPGPVELLPGSAARRPRRPVAEVVHRGAWSTSR